jgi:small-conductance mechanosensitive channel
MHNVWETIWLWLQTHGLAILFIVVGAYAVVVVLRRLTRRLERWLTMQEQDPVRSREREQRARTIRRVLNGVILFMLVVVAGAMLLRELGIEIGPLLAGAGVVGIALSLGAQSLVRDVLAGLLIVIEDHFSIGDIVSVAGVSGTVERITLRATTLRDMDGTVHVIPNGEMGVVSNKSKGWSRAILRIGVSYDTDLDRALEVLRGIGRAIFQDPAWAEYLLEEPEVGGVDDLREFDVSLLFLLKTAPGKQLALAREARKRIVETFAAEGIEMPFPTQVHLTRVLGEGDPADRRAAQGDS